MPELSGDQGGAGLRKADAHPDPIRQFDLWYRQYREIQRDVPDAVILATADPSSFPSARTVLLKGYDGHGFVFFTNYASRKARELEENRHAALAFHWRELERQVLVNGTVTRVSRQESADYFQTRPRGSQIAAHASPQSQVIPGRGTLESRFQELEVQYKGKEVPLPEFWGGYRLLPEVIEFWQGRLDRMHDRLRYVRKSAGWVIERLAP